MPDSPLVLPAFNPHDKGREQLALAVGQLFVVGFHESTPEPPDYIRTALQKGTIGGTILFRRNIKSPEQVVSLVESIHEAAADAVALPWVAVDQEGGRVVRLRAPLTKIPPMGTIGRLTNPRDVASVAEIIANEIASLGFNLNFAPVLDIHTNPSNPVIGDRAFSPDAERVAQLAGAFLLGHLMAGVVPCGKHFPGHGDTHVDSHQDLPIIEHDLERLRKVELVPFSKAAQSSFPMLMTAHIKVPVIDTVHPATLSHAMISQLLREKLNYSGVVVTDCLEMKAVSEHYEIEEMVQLALRAGVDMFLICHTEEKWRRAQEHLIGLAMENDLDRFCIVNSANRIVNLKRSMFGTLPRPWKRSKDWLATLGCNEHRDTMEKIAQKLDLSYAEWNWEEGELKDPTET